MPLSHQELVVPLAQCPGELVLGPIGAPGPSPQPNWNSMSSVNQQKHWTLWRNTRGGSKCRETEAGGEVFDESSGMLSVWAWNRVFSVVNKNSLFLIWLMPSIRALAQSSREAQLGPCCHFLKARNCFVIQNFPLTLPRNLRQDWLRQMWEGFYLVVCEWSPWLKCLPLWASI